MRREKCISSGSFDGNIRHLKVNPHRVKRILYGHI